MYRLQHWVDKFTGVFKEGTVPSKLSSNQHDVHAYSRSFLDFGAVLMELEQYLKTEGHGITKTTSFSVSLIEIDCNCHLR